MFRKLSLALAVSAALSPAGVLALGLGEIDAKSALNERFRADIELISVDLAELDTVKVTLASPTAFARVGVERPFLLSKLRFKPMALDNGRTVIQVSSRDPIREPFLNFLVEVNWPKGRLIREFTVLLDPPLTMPRKAPPIRAATTAPEQAAVRRQPLTAAAPRRGLRSMSTAGSPSSVSVEAGTTLWRIAAGLQVPDASNEQVMIALYEENPRAFARGDINRLMAGTVLDVPSRDVILALPKGQARSDFRTLASGSGTTPAKSKTKGVVKDQDELRLLTPSPREEKRPPSLETSPSPTADALADKGEMDQVKTDLILVQETSESTRQETENLRSRIRELEFQLNDIRSLLQLKSDQLAQLQAGQPAPGAELVEPPEAPRPAKAARDLSAEDVIPPLETVSAPASIQEPAAAVDVAPEAVTPPVVSAPAPKPLAPVPAPAPQKDLLDELMSNTTLLGIAGAVVIVLLSLVWLLMRRRRDAEDLFQESVLLSPGDNTTLDLNQEHEMPAKAETAGEETSFISDFSPSDIDALQEETGEVDPAAEADVYIAYGRYQQAESLINQAIERTPDRLDLKLKLLEIYFTTRNPSAFTALAEELEAMGAAQKDPRLWERLQSMGRELVPGHALFSGAAAAAAGGVVAAASMGSDSEMLANLDLDLDTELSELTEEPIGGASELASLTDGEPLEVPSANFGDLRDSAPAPRAPAAAQRGPEVVEESEFSLDLGDLDSLEDIDLGDMTEDAPALSALEPELEQEVTPLQVEESISLSSALQEEDDIPSISLDDLEDISSSLGDTSDIDQLSELNEAGSDLMEEVETKLDLARAYMEMGDGEGALEILGEVMNEGNDAQKASAQELMHEIS